MLSLVMYEERVRPVGDFTGWVLWVSFSALMAGWQYGHLTHKNLCYLFYISSFLIQVDKENWSNWLSHVHMETGKLFVNVHQVGLTTLYYVYITQPKTQNVPKYCNVSFAIGELHQAYGHVMSMSTCPKYTRHHMPDEVHRWRMKCRNV